VENVLKGSRKEKEAILTSSFLPSFKNCADDTALLQSAIAMTPVTLQNTGVIRLALAPS